MIRVRNNYIQLYRNCFASKLFFIDLYEMVNFSQKKIKIIALGVWLPPKPAIPIKFIR